MKTAWYLLKVMFFLVAIPAGIGGSIGLVGMLFTS